LIDALAAELSGDADGFSLTDLHHLATFVPSVANASYYAQRVIRSPSTTTSNPVASGASYALMPVSAIPSMK